MSLSKILSILVFTILAAICLRCGNASTARSTNRQAFRKFFGCPPCESADCPPLDPPGCASVLEPGVCGCCQVCARGQGENCGLASGRCGKGLACRPRPGDPDPLGALLDGTAVCM